jgi:hypothetical protein
MEMEDDWLEKAISSLRHNYLIKHYKKVLRAVIPMSRDNNLPGLGDIDQLQREIDHNGMVECL